MLFYGKSRKTKATAVFFGAVRLICISLIYEPCFFVSFIDFNWQATAPSSWNTGYNIW